VVVASGRGVCGPSGGETGDVQSVFLDQGPHWGRHDPGGRTGGIGRFVLGHHRAHQWQYRRGLGLHVRRAWVPAGADHAGIHESGAADAAQGVRRRGGADAGGPGDARGRGKGRGVAAHRAGGVYSAAVRQSGQSRHTRPDHGR